MPLDLPPLKYGELMRRHKIIPSKSLGQNFLVEAHALERIVNAADIQPSDTVLEVGPGLGSLTRRLAGAARRVIAVELDARLLPVLQEVLAPFTNVEIIEGDILQVNLEALLTQPGYLVVANIPYYITSALIRQLLETHPRPHRLVLTVQREVAARICAEPGEMSLLALSVQVYGAPQIVARIPAGAFFPSPKVDSAVVRVDLYASPRIPSDQIEVFFTLARAGFSQKRKTLRNALSAGLQWNKPKTEEICARAGIDARRRAQTLSLEEWQRLVEAYTPTSHTD